MNQVTLCLHYFLIVRYILQSYQQSGYKLQEKMQVIHNDLTLDKLCKCL